MANKNSKERNIRKIARIGNSSLGLTLPIELLKLLGWKEKQKVVVKKIHGGVMIKDWKK